MSDGPRPGILDDANRIASAGLSAAFAIEWFGYKSSELRIGATDAVASTIRRRVALLK